MSSNSGIFGLSGFNDKNLEGLIPDKTRESYREYGYFGGGDVAKTSVDRKDYSNDTTTNNVRSSFPTTAKRGAAAGNSNFGYFATGSIGSVLPGTDGTTTTYRIDYSNDTTTTSVGQFVQGKFRSGATGNSNFGYFSGGEVYISIGKTIVERLDYSSDLTTASIRGPLVAAKRYHSGVSNSNFGYFAGGAQNSSMVYRVNYSNDTQISSIRGSLIAAKNGSGSTGNSNFGYFVGGLYTQIDRIDYSNDTATANQNIVFPTDKLTSAATGNSNFGYFSGGIIPGTPSTLLSLIERIDYSNDSATASIRGPMSTERYVHAATSSHSFGGSPISQYGVFTKPFGYFGGGSGNTPGGSSSVFRLDYSNDTQLTTKRTNLRDPRWGLSAIGNNNFGYFCGGSSTPGLTEYSTIDRIDYSNDNNSIIRNSLNISKRYSASCGNSNFGFISGGLTSGPTNYSSVERLDYSNDNINLKFRGTLSQSKSFLSAVGTNNFGYIGGGTLFPSPIYSTIERIDYSNDTSTAVSRSLLLTAKRSLSATGNSNFGYFAGGFTGTLETSKIERLDYSNDTSNAIERTNLRIGRFALSATGTQNFGYFCGGTSPIPGYFSTIDRIDYATDTSGLTIRSSLPIDSGYNAATSPTAFGGATYFQPTQTFFDIQSMKRIEDTTNESVKKRALGSYGYFGGGSIPASTVLSTIDRIDYANDTSTASVRGPLSSTRYANAATGNSNFGYYIAGNIAIPTAITTTIDRVDYSNDGATSLLRGNITSGSSGRSFGATGNSNFGYIGNWSYSSSTNRIDYSNDNLTASIRGPLSSAKSYVAATGNSNFGYFGGGYSPTNVYWSQIDRINYSNDLSRSSIRGPLSLVKWVLAATSSQNFGYFGGGGNASIPAFYSTVDRIDYSNDTQTASVRGPLTIARRFLAASGNSNFGYFGGGNPGPVSRVDRIDYSNDTQAASARGPLSNGKFRPAATTNAQNS